MTDNISIKSEDGFELGCYRSAPEGSAKAVVVVIQEIFGVNSHIREVADRYAENGYTTFAPKLFDRIGLDIELGYSDADMAKGIDLAFNQLDLSMVIADVRATVRHAEVMKLFDEVVESSKEGIRKPDPQIYLTACQRVGVEPSDAVFFGRPRNQSQACSGVRHANH